MTWEFDSDGKQFSNIRPTDGVLGTGASGIVFRSNIQLTSSSGSFLGNGAVIAVKHLKVSRRDDYMDCKDEVVIMKQCKNHANLVQFIGSAYNETEKLYAIAMEMGKMPLDVFVNRLSVNIKGLPQYIFMDLIQDCSSALNSLHVMNIAHRDIKSQNILVFDGPSKGRRSSYLFKMCDFGSSRNANTMTTLRGTPSHLHPTLAACLRPNGIHVYATDTSYTKEQVDIWSLACTFVHCATGAQAFPSSSDVSIYCNCVTNLPKGAIGATGIVKATKPVPVVNYQYKYKLENKSYPSWFVHCATRMLVSMFHTQKRSELTDISQTLATVKESTFLVFDAPSRVEIIKYADLKSIPLFTPNYPKLYEVLGLPQFNGPYYVISDLLVTPFSEYFEPAPGRTYIIMKDTTEKWNIPVNPPNIINDNRVGPDSARIRRQTISDAIEAITDADNWYTLFQSAISVLEKHLEKLESSDDHKSQLDLMKFHSTLAERVRQMAKFTAIFSPKEASSALKTLPRVDDSLMNNTTKLEVMIDDIKELLTVIRSLDMDKHEMIGVQDQLSSLIVPDPELEKVKYTQTHEYSKILLQECVERKQKVAKQLEKHLNGTLATVSMKVIRLHQDFKSVQSDIIADRLSVDEPLQKLIKSLEGMCNEHGLKKEDIKKAIDIAKRPDQARELSRANLQLALNCLATLQAAAIPTPSDPTF